MANTYTSLHYHIVFSTMHRHPWIHQDIEQRVWEYIGGIARQNDMKALQVGGIEGHLYVESHDGDQQGRALAQGRIFQVNSRNVSTASTSDSANRAIGQIPPTSDSHLHWRRYHAPTVR